MSDLLKQVLGLVAVDWSFSHVLSCEGVDFADHCLT